MEPKNHLVWKATKIIIRSFIFGVAMFNFKAVKQLVEQCLWSSQNVEWKSSPFWFHHFKTPIYFHPYLFFELAITIPKKQQRINTNVPCTHRSMILMCHVPQKTGSLTTFGSRIFLRQNSQDELGWKEPGSLAAQVFAVWRILMDQSLRP